MNRVRFTFGVREAIILSIVAMAISVYVAIASN